MKKETVLLYEYMDGQPYPGIVVSPAPASEIHEPTIPRVEELGKSLAIGTGAAIATGLGALAFGLSVPLTILLSGGAFAGATILSEEAMKESDKKSLRFQVSPAPASQIHEPTYPRVEEI